MSAQSALRSPAISDSPILPAPRIAILITQAYGARVVSRQQVHAREPGPLAGLGPGRRPTLGPGPEFSVGTCTAHVRHAHARTSSDKAARLPQLPPARPQRHDREMVVAIIVSLILVMYGISLAVHPFRTCAACHGTGRHRGTLFAYSHRQCSSCGGQGRHRRLGTVLFSGHRSVWAEKSALKARDSRWNRPR